MEKELKILTATVTIQLITVDGKRMTKSVFNQIQDQNCFNENFDFVGDSMLGYIIIDGIYLLWIMNGELRKTTLSYLSAFAKMDIMYELNRGALPSCILDSYKKWSNDQFYTLWRDRKITELFSFQKRFNEFLNKIKGNQLYISI